MKQLSLIGSLIAGAAFTTVGVCQTPPRSISVSYVDLDLTQKRDMRTLDRRIERAIDRLCGSTDMAKSGFELQRVNMCRQQANGNVATQLAAIIARRPTGLAVMDISARP